MNKKITSSALAALMIAGSTSFTAFASMASGTVVIGTKAFDINYVNDAKNVTEITNAILAGGAIYVKDFGGNWINNVTGLKVEASVIPAVTYKSVTGVVTNFDAKDMDSVANVAVSSVSAISANSIKVTLNKAVDTTKAVLSMKMGTVAANIKSVTWNDAKTEATLTGYGSFAAGDYTVTVSGLDNIDATKNSGNVTFTAQKVASIAFTGTKAILTSTGALTATAGYVIKDQYGTDVTSTYEGALSVSATGTSIVPTHTGGLLTMTFAATQAVDTTIVATLVDSATGVVGTTTLKVAAPSAADSITLGALTNVDSKVLRTSTVVGTDLFQYDVTALDQYGTAVTTAGTLASDFIVLYSDAALTSTFVSKTSTAPAKLKITGIPATAGTYTITLVSKTSGKSLVVPVVVSAAIGVSTFTMQTPVTAVTKGETTVIPFAALDQYGNALTKFADLNGNITFTVADVTVNAGDKATVAFEKNAVDGTAVLKVTTPTANTATSIIVTSIVNGKTSTSQLNLAVKAVKVATTIQSLSADVARKLVIGATSSIADTDFVINDQYGRAMDLPAAYSIKLASATLANVTTGTAITTTNAGTLTGVAAGSSVITATLYGPTTGANPTGVVANSGIDFTASTVAKADITSYGIDTQATVYAAPITLTALEKAAYAADYTVYGMNAAGDKIALDQSTSGLDLVTISSTNANLSVAGGKIAATPLTPASTDQTATIVAVVNGANGIVTVTKTVTLSDKAPVGGTVAAKATSGSYVTFASGVAVMTATNANLLNTKVVSSSAQYYAVPNRASVYFEVLDQYGVASKAVQPAYYTVKSTKADGTTAITGSCSITTAGVITTTGLVSGDIVTITAITTDGKVSSVKVIVQ